MIILFTCKKHALESTVKKDGRGKVDLEKAEILAFVTQAVR